MSSETPPPCPGLSPSVFLQDIATMHIGLDDPTARNVFPLSTSELTPDSELVREARIAEALRRFAVIAAGMLSRISVQATVHCENNFVYIGTDQGLFRDDGTEILPVSERSSDANVPDERQSSDVRAMAVDHNGVLWVGTAKGLNCLIGSSWLSLSGADGLPLCDTTHLAIAAEGSIWIGTPQGAVLLRMGKWRYYAGCRWLPDDFVTGLSVEPNGDCWVRTATGASHIQFIEMTLPRKAEHHESITAARHNRDGFVTDCRLTIPGDLETSLPEASDNDGLWTSLYVCAESFRFATTREEAARDLARLSLRAILSLVHVTGIPGFPARAIVRAGERVKQSDPGPNWHPSPVQPGVHYKADTSSDEIAGHYLAWYVYSALVASPAERIAIAEVCRAVTDHILENDYTLVGPTGKRTTWGVWSPEVLNGDPDWSAERGLNSLEILSHLKVAVHLCGDARFAEAYRTLIVRHGYALNTVRQKVLPPEGEINHSDDELAACAYYPLLMLEADPALRSLYLLSLERTQAILRPEGSALYNFLYAALAGRACDTHASLQWLRDSPYDLRHWSVTNSHRADIAIDPLPGRFGEVQSLHPLPPNERTVAKWNHNPYALDGGDEGKGEEDGTFWLLPYWLASYHGLIGSEDSI